MLAFISFASADSAAAELVCKCLEQHGISCFIAPRNIKIGRNYGEEIADAITSSSYLVVIISEHTGESDHVPRELELGMQNALLIVPFCISPSYASKKIEYFIAGLQRIDASRGLLDTHAIALASELMDKIKINAERLSGSAKVPQDSVDIETSLGNEGTLAKGRMIGHYRLEKLIGEGGGGFVYHASDEKFNRDVCIKILRPLIDNNIYSSIFNVFKSSIKATASIDNVGIYRIYDYGQYDDLWHSFWVCGELINGETIVEWSRRPHSLKERCRISAQICDALSVAHRHQFVDEYGMLRTGVFHGDLKPNNIMVRHNGEPVLIDFMLPDIQAVLKAPPEGKPITRIFGTIGYMSPEQSDGIISAQSDIFSVGRVIQYILLPAVSPEAWFVANETHSMKHSLLVAILSRLNVRSSTLFPSNIEDIPRQIVSITNAALANSPHDRPTLTRLRDVLATFC